MLKKKTKKKKKKKKRKKKEKEKNIYVCILSVYGVYGFKLNKEQESDGKKNKNRTQKLLTIVLTKTFESWCKCTHCFFKFTR